MTPQDILTQLFHDVFDITDMFIRDKDAVKFRDIYEKKLAVFGKEIASIEVNEDEKLNIMNGVIIARIINLKKINSHEV